MRCIVKLSQKCVFHSHIMFVIGFNARGEIYCFETKIYWFPRPNLLVKGIEG